MVLDIQLPKGWKRKTLGDAYQIILGQSPPSDTYNTEGIGLPFYQGKAEFGDLYPTKVKWCSSPVKIAEAGDILISVRAPVGPTNLCQEKSCIGRGLAALRIQNGMPNKYLLYFLRLIEKEWDSRATGTTFKAITGNVLRQQVIPLAPLPEQERIVAKIEELFTQLDAGVAGLRRVQAALKRYKASVLKAACEGRLVEQDPNDEPAKDVLRRILKERKKKLEDEQRSKGKYPRIMKYTESKVPDMKGLPGLPEGWCWVRVDQIGQVQLGRQRSPKHHYGPFMFPYIRAANLSWNGLDLSDVMKMNFPPGDFVTYKLEVGDILLSEASGSISEAGKPAIWQGQIENCCFQNTVIRVKSEGPLPSYLYFHFLSDALSGRFRRVARGVGIHHIGSNRLSEFIIAIPPLQEQKRIVWEIERRFSVVQELEQTIQDNLKRAGRLRQAILKRAFEGRLVAQGPDDEPVQALLERAEPDDGNKVEGTFKQARLF